MTTAREEVLRRIRAAGVRDGAGPTERRGADVPRAYRTTSPLERDAVLHRFVERVEEYRATVARVPAPRAAEAVVASLEGARSVVVAADLPGDWVEAARAAGLEVVVDAPESPPSAVDLDAVDAVVTAASAGVAETGTVVLDGGPGQGRRAISLVPDLHVLVVRAEQVVATVPEAVRRLDPTRPQTWISGPSATSDIELDRVEGVHGPRTLRVVLLDA